MPLCEFRWRDCDRQFSLALRVEDYDRTTHRCPRCGGGDLERMREDAEAPLTKKSA
jgi:putative FmdB family regulatory protein